MDTLMPWENEIYMAEIVGFPQNLFYFILERVGPLSQSPLHQSIGIFILCGNGKALESEPCRLGIYVLSVHRNTGIVCYKFLQASQILNLDKIYLPHNFYQDSQNFMLKRSKFTLLINMFLTWHQKCFMILNLFFSLQVHVLSHCSFLCFSSNYEPLNLKSTIASLKESNSSTLWPWTCCPCILKCLTSPYFS